MAWVETFKHKSGEIRYRVCERGPDGRIVKSAMMLDRRDAERLAGKTGIEKQREELELIKKDYPVADFLTELPTRLKGTVSDSYAALVATVAGKFARFLAERAPGVRKLSQVTKPLLLEYRRFRLEATVQSSGKPYAAPAGAPDEVTVAEAAVILGYRHNAALRLVTAGLLEARKVKVASRFAHHLIARASLAAYMASKSYARGKNLAAKRRKKADAVAAAAPKKKIKNRTINHELTIIWSMLNKAVEWGLMDDNPVPTSKGLQLPEYDSKEFRALTDQEFDAFRRSCPEWLFPPLMAAALLGLREEEIRQLEWTDVDLQGRVVHIRWKSNLTLKSQGRTGIREYRLPMPDALHKILSALHLKRGAFADTFVFHNTVGRQIAKGSLRKSFAHTLKGCGITDVTQVHALRKTFITHQARRVKNPFLLQQLARHRDIRTTMRYVNIFDEDKRAAMEGFDIGSGSRTAPDAPAAGPEALGAGEGVAG